MLRTNIYIDGFNLYYGAVKGTPYKWLNVAEMCRRMLRPENVVNEIKYFTARISVRPEDPDQQVRQETYLRALRTIPSLKIIFGHFFTNEHTALLAGCPPGKPKYVRVMDTEEKGSDVNLAVHAVHDGHKGMYDVAVLVTNDSDLLEPIRIIRRELRLHVGVLCPYDKPTVMLQRFANFCKPIDASVIAASQFPKRMTDKDGVFHKPDRW